MANVNLIVTRSICTTLACYGKRNFRKFPIYNKRGSRKFKEQQRLHPNSDIPIDKRGVRDIGYTLNGRFVQVPQMVPELIVPDLNGCKLKPYVSYRAPDVIQSEFTAEDLFHVVYAPKIKEDFAANKLNAEDGTAIAPSENEKLSADEALLKARQTGADVMQ